MPVIYDNGIQDYGVVDHPQQFDLLKGPDSISYRCVIFDYLIIIK